MVNFVSINRYSVVIAASIHRYSALISASQLVLDSVREEEDDQSITGCLYLEGDDTSKVRTDT